MKLEIRLADNGYILKGKFNDSEIVSEKVITNEDELVAMQELLEDVKEYFCIFYSKHNKKNIEITIEEA